MPENAVFERYPKPRYGWAGILLITLVILAIVVAVIMYAVLRNRQSSNITRCEPGLCAIRYDTGDKRCPLDADTRLQINPVFEGCTSNNYCQDPNARCAVLAGGVLDCSGVCGIGNDGCRCEDAP
tara:strand:- start:57450 stop:57824 length:375 start_codon:yes stop_codon:yes gene_type:complete